MAPIGEPIQHDGQQWYRSREASWVKASKKSFESSLAYVAFIKELVTKELQKRLLKEGWRQEPGSDIEIDVADSGGHLFIEGSVVVTAETWVWRTPIQEWERRIQVMESLIREIEHGIETRMDPRGYEELEDEDVEYWQERIDSYRSELTRLEVELAEMRQQSAVPEKCINDQAN